MSDSVIANIAARQFGLFSRGQVHAAGSDDDVVHRRLAAGRWLCMAPGVYSLPGFPESWPRSLWLAHLDAGRQSVVSHEAAAAMHRLLNFPPGPVTLLAPHGDHHRPSPPAFVHQPRDLRAGHITRLDGLPVTTMARTFCDLAATCGRGRLERALDDAHLTRRCSLNDVLDLAASLRRPGKRGIKTLLELVGARGPGVTVPESELERQLAVVLRDAGLSGFVFQHELPWRRDLPGRVDILYPTDKVIIEADSRRWHGRVDAMAEDRRRDREAQNHGYRVYRFLHEEVMYAPEVVCEAVRIALATSDRSVGSAA